MAAAAIWRLGVEQYEGFRGRGDERENMFIWVKTHALPRCIYDAFMYKISVDLRQNK